MQKFRTADTFNEKIYEMTAKFVEGNKIFIETCIDFAGCCWNEDVSSSSSSPSSSSYKHVL